MVISQVKKLGAKKVLYSNINWKVCRFILIFDSFLSIFEARKNDLKTLVAHRFTGFIPPQLKKTE